MALTDDLISYWKLDEASGNALDAHGSNDLTDTNAVGSAAGKINNARDFESGSTQYFTKADNADLSTGDIDFTLSCWVNAESLGTRTILGKFVGGAFEYRIGFNASGLLTWRCWTNQTVSGRIDTANGAVAVGTWLHIVAWHDSVNDVIGLALNAGTATTVAHTTGVQDTTAPFGIGAWGSGSEPFDGLIDEVGFWKRVLTSQERTDLYNGGAGLSYDSFGGASPQTLTVPLLTNTQTFPAATITPGAVSLSPPLLTNAQALYAPTITVGSVALQPPLIESAAQLFAPTVTQGGVSLQLPLIGSVDALYAPTITVGSVTLLLPLLDSATVLYPPVVGGGAILEPASGATASDSAYLGATASDSAYLGATASDSEG